MGTFGTQVRPLDEGVEGSRWISILEQRLATSQREGPGVFSVWILQVPLPSVGFHQVLVQSRDSKVTCECGRFPVSAVHVSPVMRWRLVQGVPHLSLSQQKAGIASSVPPQPRDKVEDGWRDVTK